MRKIESKIHRAIAYGRLNPTILGRRKWYNYVICSDELIWARNLRDGYQIHVYDLYENHLVTLIV